MVRRILLLAALAAVAAVIAGSAYSAGGGTMAQAQAAGWDCNPQILIIGYYHCAPPGKPSVADMIPQRRHT